MQNAGADHQCDKQKEKRIMCMLLRMTLLPFRRTRMAITVIAGICGTSLITAATATTAVTFAQTPRWECWIEAKPVHSKSRSSRG
mmetsp:Transcript_65042/g.141765  ORF Transcript_65042/g.141765 Transcript_65042/m.141765 type:complete len:85 (+) Transcript_65042:403-657(+)